MGCLQQMCSSLISFVLAVSLSLPHVYLLCRSPEENSFVSLDHSGIGATEFVSLLEETEFTIHINAFPAPKVAWLKDGEDLSQNYFVHTKTSHLEGNR